MYQLFGLEPGTAVTPEVYHTYAVKKDLAVAQRIADSLQLGKDFFEEDLHIQVDGSIRQLRVKGKAILHENGKTKKIVGVDWLLPGAEKNKNTRR